MAPPGNFFRAALCHFVKMMSPAALINAPIITFTSNIENLHARRRDSRSRTRKGDFVQETIIFGMSLHLRASHQCVRVVCELFVHIMLTVMSTSETDSFSSIFLSDIDCKCMYCRAPKDGSKQSHLVRLQWCWDCDLRAVAVPGAGWNVQYQLVDRDIGR